MDEATVKSLLAPLFAQFATADGDMSMKLVGYLIALERATPQALNAAVRSYLCGEVADHDGRFLPTSAELARVVREEQAHLHRIASKPLLLVDASPPEPGPEPSEEDAAKERARIAAKIKAAFPWAK